MSVDLSPFIKDAQKIQEETGIPASIILGQIILESSGKYDGGLSGLAAKAKNLFGIKGKGSAGSISMPTTEVVNGKSVKVFADFRAYTSFYDSMKDHAALLSTERYAKHLKDAKSVNEYAEGIKAGGYATDPNYVNKLLNVISNNDLHKFDGSNFSFTPVEGSSSSSSSASSNNNNMIETVIYSVWRGLFLLLLFILMVVFFLKAFPAVENTATNVIPQAKALKTMKGVIS